MYTRTTTKAAAQLVASAAFAALVGTALPAHAEGFAPIRDKAEFVGIVKDKALTRLGITLNVSPNGAIRGSAFGTPVTGAWNWRGGLFCRDLFYGKKDLGANCQTVQRKGNTLRFTSDAGKGDSADLRVK